MQSSSESEVSKNISNETVCQYFYVLFIVSAIMAGVVVLADVYVIASSPKAGFLLLLRSAPTVVIAVLNSLFLYIMCTRTLLKKSN
jgi:hypothetical protein